MATSAHLAQSPQESHATGRPWAHSCDCWVTNADSHPALGHRVPGVPPRGNHTAHTLGHRPAPEGHCGKELHRQAAWPSFSPLGPHSQKGGCRFLYQSKSAHKGPFQLSGTAGVGDCPILLGRCSESLPRKPENPALS